LQTTLAISWDEYTVDVDPCSLGLPADSILNKQETFQYFNFCCKKEHFDVLDQ